MASFKRVILCLTLLASTTVFCSEQIKPLFNYQAVAENFAKEKARKKFYKTISECSNIEQLQLTLALFNQQSYPVLVEKITNRISILEQQAAHQDLSSSFICLLQNQQKATQSQATTVQQLKAFIAKIKQEKETIAANKQAAADKVAQLEASAQERTEIIMQHEAREQLLVDELIALQNDKTLRRKSLEDIQKKLAAATKAYNNMNQEHEEEDATLLDLIK